MNPCLLCGHDLNPFLIDICKCGCHKEENK